MNLWWRLLLIRLRQFRAQRVSLWDIGETRFRVVPTDLDPLLHMNNARYLALMDLGRYDLLRRSGWWDQILERGWGAVVAGQTITYRRSLKLGQRFVLRTRVVGMDERWAYLEQRFMVGDDLYAHALVRVRFVKRAGGTVDMADLREAIGDVPERLAVEPWMTDWTHHTRHPVD